MAAAVRSGHGQPGHAAGNGALGHPQNAGSWRVLEKAGMRYEGLVGYFGLTGLKKYAAGQDEQN